MSNTQQEPQNRYQRGKTIINGNTKYDNWLRLIDLISSHLFKLGAIPPVSYGVKELAKWWLQHFH